MALESQKCQKKYWAVVNVTSVCQHVRCGTDSREAVSLTYAATVMVMQ